MYEQEIYDAVRCIKPSSTLREIVIQNAKSRAERREERISRRNRQLSFFYPSCEAVLMEAGYNPDYFKNSPLRFMLCEIDGCDPLFIRQPIFALNII